MATTVARPLLTLDANVFIAALKPDEPSSEPCRALLDRVPDAFLLVEPSLVYQEVCGTLARRVGAELADHARAQLDGMLLPTFVVNSDRAFCVSAYPLCFEYSLYAIDAVYLKVALDANAALVSLDHEDFIEKVRAQRRDVKAYHVSEFR